MITGRLGAFNEPVNGSDFGSRSMDVLPVVVVDGQTNSPMAFHRNNSTRPQLPWEREPSLRERLAASITAEDQTGAPLLFQLDALEKKIQAYLRGKQDEQVIDLRAELAGINARGKAAVQEVRAAVEALNIARGSYNAHLEEVTKSRKSLAAAKAATPNDDDFFDEEEISEHRAKLADAQARHDAVMAQSKRLDAAVKKAGADARQAEQALAAIKARRAELRSMLDGGGKRQSPVASLGPVGLRG